MTEQTQDSRRPGMCLRDYSVANTYTSCFLTEVDDLDVAAKLLVSADFALSAYVADGNAYWRNGKDVVSGAAELVMREHENHATINFPDGLTGLAQLGVQSALLHRFSERKVLTSIDGSHHQYLRAFLSPFLVGFGSSDLLVQAELKLYKVGVFTLTLTVDTPEDGIGVPALVERYVNLFARWADRVHVPTGVAVLGSSSVLLNKSHEDKRARGIAVGTAALHRKVGVRGSATIDVAGTPLSFFPAHMSVEEILAALAEEERREPGGTGPGPDSQGTPEAGAGEGANTVPPDETADGAAATDNATVSPPESAADGGADDQSRASFILSDIFENLAFALQVVLDPPRDGKEYIRHGPKSSSLQRGTHWHARPLVVIKKFDDQPTTASEIRERFRGELGSIMGRVARAPARVVATQMTDSLRLFEDHTLHVNSALTLCVFAARHPASPREYPEFCSVFDVACAVEMIDYYPARIGQLIGSLSDAKTMKAVRDIRAELTNVEATARVVFRSGELRDALSSGWNALGVPAMMVEAREKTALQVEVLAEANAERSGAQNMMLTVVFGVLGAAGIADVVVRPIWEALFEAPAGRWGGPFYFALTATLLGVVLWMVSGVIRRR